MNINKERTSLEVKLEENLDFFRERELFLKRNPSLKTALNLIQIGMDKRIPVYYSEVLENFFIDFAEKTKILPKNFDKIKCEKNHFLHIMTKTYLTGGHTRIVERWIDSSKSDTKHSLVLTDQDDLKAIPKKLVDAVKKSKGDFVQINTGISLQEKANKLRVISKKYEALILHHNPVDPLPLMAFSIKEFKKPILCFNHSGHTFWIGREIIDYNLDLENGQNQISTFKRGLPNSEVINMPIDKLYREKFDKQKLRKNLKISKTQKVLISMASDYKYNPIQKLSFTDFLRNLMKKDSDIIFLGIGINYASNKEWENLSKEFGKNRIRLFGVIEHKNIKSLLRSADLYIDSFPYNSWLSLNDAINIGNLPALVLKTPAGYNPYLQGSNAICASLEELHKRTLEYLNSKSKKTVLFKDLKKRLDKECSIECFSNTAEESIKKTILLSKKPKRFLPIQKEFVSLDYYHMHFVKSNKRKAFGIPFIFEFIKQKNLKYKMKKIKLFGITIFSTKKRLF